MSRRRAWRVSSSASSRAAISARAASLGGARLAGFPPRARRRPATAGATPPRAAAESPPPRLPSSLVALLILAAGTLTLVGGEVRGLPGAARDEFAKPQELLGAARGAGVFGHKLAVEAEEREHRRGAHAIVLEGEFLLRHFLAAEIGHRCVAVHVHHQDAEMLAVIILHRHLIEHRGLHFRAPRAIP